MSEQWPPSDLEELKKAAKSLLRDRAWAPELEALGFEQVKIRSYTIFVHKARGLVVKASKVYQDNTPPRAVPTILLHERSSNYVQVLLQPYVDTSHGDLLRDKLYENFCHSEVCDLYGNDLHAGNIGLYNGEPVAIDW